jgi:large subunit ribosomal protein L10
MVAVAKSLNDTARQTKVLSLKGGILQGQPVGPDEVQKLAALPPTNVLQAQVLGAVVGPLNAIVGLFTAPLRDLVGVLDGRIQQLQEQGETVEPEAPAREPRVEETTEPEAEASEEAAETEAAAEEPESEEVKEENTNGN